jgi:hypothetical protein
MADAKSPMQKQRAIPLLGIAASVAGSGPRGRAYGPTHEAEA